MAIEWPSSLQQCLNSDSFSLEKGVTTIRSDNDIGVPKVRRRYTKGSDKWNVGFNITMALYSTFEDFFDNDLNGGVNVFEFNHPIKNVLVNMRFIDAYQVDPIGGLNFRVTAKWEEIPI